MATQSLPPDLDFVRNRDASPERMNAAMLWIYSQILALQSQRQSLDDMLSTLQTVGLTRINDAIQPVYKQLVSIVSLGVLFNATSASALPVVEGATTFTVDEAMRAQFAFCGFMVAVSLSDSRNAMMGRVSSYDRVSGALAMDVFIASGDLGSTVSDWEIMPCVPPFLPASSIDPGTDGTADIVAIPYVLNQELGQAIAELDPGLDTGSDGSPVPPTYLPGLGVASELDPGLA